MFKGLVTDIFFDLDHTLWDFEKNSALTFERILKLNRVSVDLEKFLEIYIPVNLAYWKLYREERISKEDLRFHRLKVTFNKLGYAIDSDTIHTLANDYIGLLSSFNHLFPNTLEILDYLKPNYRLHIITNGFKEIQEKKLRNSGILDYFELIVNSESAGVKKPNPRIFKMALKMAGVSCRNSIMVGDNLEADILGAKAVGFHTLHFNVHKDPFHKHCKMITDLSEIKMYL